MSVERRHFMRRQTPGEHGVLGVRVRPGRHAILVNVSVDGALLESEYPLRPNAAIELQMSALGGDVSVRGQVVRCSVCRLSGTVGASYRSAIRFNDPHPWFLADGERASPFP